VEHPSFREIFKKLSKNYSWINLLI
jgi:hypothetical protein